jgi:hypothetical protein
MRALLPVALLCACSSTPAPTGPASDTASPKESPVAYKVLEDRTDNNAVEYHVLVTDPLKHDDADGLLKFLYRYLMTRRDEPASVVGAIYANEAAFKTPPRTPIAQVTRKSGENGPTFDNKVPLEFSQEIELALHPARPAEDEDAFKKRRAEEEKAAHKLKVERDDAQKAVTVTLAFIEPGTDKWVDTLSFNQAMNNFTDVAQALFEGVQQLRQLTFVGLWKDKEVIRIALARTDYTALKLNEIDDRIGQHHGRSFLALSLGKQSDKAAAKENAQLVAKEYKSVLNQLKGKAKVDPALK